MMRVIKREEVEKYATYDDAFIRDFYESEKDKGLIWDNYYYNYSKRLERLLNEHEIIIDKKINIDEIKKLKDYRNYYSAVELSSVYFRPKRKFEKLIEHDAVHLLMIKKKREEDKCEGYNAKYWFVTYDTTLYPVSSYFATQKSPPFSVLADTCLQTLSLFRYESHKDKAIDISQLLTEFLQIPFVQTSTAIIPDKIKAVLYPLFPYESMDYAETFAVAQEQFIKDSIVSSQEEVLSFYGRLAAEFKMQIKQTIDDQREKRENKLIRQYRLIAILLSVLTFLLFSLLDFYIYTSFNTTITNSGWWTTAFWTLVSTQVSLFGLLVKWLFSRDRTI